MKIAALFPAILVVFTSCSSASSVKSSVAFSVANNSALTTGKVIDTIVCNAAPDQCYAIYLPSYYTPSRSFPCIYFFDAHARGRLPLKQYKDLAEKYGFIFIGSDISKNGMPWEETNEVVKALMKDTKVRINIDSNRIYTCGFSGGARVAANIAIVNGGIAGVICCASGLPQIKEPVQNKFLYCGIVGEYDFNFSEMEKLNSSLLQYGFPAQLLTFEGIHEWPPVGEFNTALLWMQVNSMKQHLQPKNDTLIAACIRNYDAYISNAASVGDLIKEHNLLIGLIEALNGLTDITSWQKRSDNLVNSKGYKSALSFDASSQRSEAEGQQLLQEEFTTHNESWWAAKVKSLKQKSKHTETLMEANMNKRLISFLGLLGYLNSSHALSINDLAHADTYLNIFKIADAKNPDCSYLRAVYYMKKGDQQHAISSLYEAAILGYNDLSQLMADAAFNSFHTNAEFKTIMEEINRNL